MVPISSPVKKNCNAGKLPLPEQERMDLARVKRTIKFEQTEFNKRQNTTQWSFDSNVPYLPNNLINEPGPLGLRMTKSESLLDLIQSKLSQVNINRSKKDVTKSVKPKVKIPGPSEKLKASNFPAVLLRIGKWEYKSKYEGDLVAKCYFAKHKLVWEVLDGGLKNKIEIQWADIVGLKADCPDNEPGTLTVMLDKQPLFFRETDPQPRKHTIWQPTTDFTDGNASAYRQHFLRFAPGVLNKHYEKLIQSDTRLNFLSQQSNAFFEAPVEDPNVLNCNNNNNNNSSNHNHREFVKENGHVGSSGVAGSKAINEPGAYPSIVPDAVNYVRSTPGEANLKQALEDLSRFLLSDTPLTSGLYVTHLTSRVNTLCGLVPNENGPSDNSGPDSRNDDQVKDSSPDENHHYHYRAQYIPPLATSPDENENGNSGKDSYYEYFDMLPTIVNL